MDSSSRLQVVDGDIKVHREVLLHQRLHLFPCSTREPAADPGHGDGEWANDRVGPQRRVAQGRVEPAQVQGLRVARPAYSMLGEQVDDVGAGSGRSRPRGG